MKNEKYINEKLLQTILIYISKKYPVVKVFIIQPNCTHNIQL